MSLLHWLAVHLGLTSANSPWYLLWSGIGSDLSELAIIGAVLGTYRHHQCAAKGCWRLARYDVAGHKVCRRCTPTGFERPTREHIHALHRAANEAREAIK